MFGGAAQGLHRARAQPRGEPVEHLLELLAVLRRARKQIVLHQQGLQQFVGRHAESVHGCGQHGRGEPLARQRQQLRGIATGPRETRSPGCVSAPR